MGLPTPPADACYHCKKASINADYRQAFGINICNQCTSLEPVISKSTAKATYLLSEADLSSLGALQRSNPRHKEWTPMKMYLVSQVESVAVAKHGSLEAVTQQKQQKVRDKIEDRAKRRKTVEQDERKEQAHMQQLTAVLKKYSEQSPLQEVDFVDPDDGKRKKRFAPGLAAAEVEEL
eukprot:GHUV01008072.1.p1 GENE.GHUV01008072.1~~GHUV01008072.1.p1  ORF type:complete len:178 (+),score=56.33 GHUV01008072.1:410-943(+)